MTTIWHKICEVFTDLVKPTRRKTRVTFSPSTLHRELERRTKLSATNNPFFNFLAELRLKSQDNEFMNRSLNQRDMVRITKTAGHLWQTMSEEEKQPYRKMAVEQRKLKRLKRKRRSPWFSDKRRRRKRRKSQTHIPPQVPELIGDGPSVFGDTNQYKIN
ncbi:uncharacterized protein LOC135962214 [Calliphora vicina]|uniref:uncharacterized protein LOC135962214 n=1 Tax=Calliphora vicina TaxID=7373 RepID=UPI00325B8581